MNWSEAGGDLGHDIITHNTITGGYSDGIRVENDEGTSIQEHNIVRL